MTIASPCTGICKLDDTTGWCLGCGRTGDEMDGWRTSPEEVRQAAWDQIPDRLSQLGVTCQRLPWTTQDIRTFVTSTLENKRGTWVIGVVGAVAEFTAFSDAETQISEIGDDLIANTRDGAMRLAIRDDVRALTFGPPGLAVERRIVLAVKRERGSLSKNQGVTDLGWDADALMEEPNTRLFDLGLGRKEGRIGVRLEPGAARDALRSVTGETFSQALPKIGSVLLAESPTRVVESALGRIEVQGQIPPPDAKSPPGPHTHLLPDYLAAGRALPTGMDLPRAYLPGAIYYPPR
ncbi:MAG: DUF1289 domain-containing protein [Pseudomonadota bacterium]